MVRPFVNANSSARRGVAVGALLLLAALLLPAILNGVPIFYSDSVGYFHSGYAALEQLKAMFDAWRPHVSGALPLAEQEHTAIGTARSVYYGVPLVASYWAGGMWAFALAQVLATASALMLAARHAMGHSTGLGRREMFVLCALALFTGLNVFAVTALPDLWAGLMLLGVAMILAYARGLSRLEYGFWLIAILAAALFHKALLAILALTLLVAAPFLWRARGRELALLAAAALLALLGHGAVDWTVARLTGKPVVPVPFLLARMVGDGTAEPYLKETCPVRHYATCAYLGRMPMPENDFLWSRDPARSVMATATPATRAAIAGEANAIAMGVIWRDPAGVAVAAVKNAFRQFADVGVGELATLPHDDVQPIRYLRYGLERYGHSAIAQGRMPLSALSAMMRAVYFASLLGALTLLFRRRADKDVFTFTLLLFLGLAANAIVSGAISGVFDRYQGRVAWLAAFALAALLATRPAEEG